MSPFFTREVHKPGYQFKFQQYTFRSILATQSCLLNCILFPLSLNCQLTASFWISIHATRFTYSYTFTRSSQMINQSLVFEFLSWSVQVDNSFCTKSYIFTNHHTKMGCIFWYSLLSKSKTASGLGFQHISNCWIAALVANWF